MLDNDIKILFDDANLFLIYLIYLLSVHAIKYYIFYMWSERDDAVYGQCSTV